MIDRSILLKIARDAAEQRMAACRSLLSAYLTGSVAANEPMLGEATDIDLILIDAEPPPVPREIIRLSDQVILDVQYRHQAEYANPKLLRIHPWRGPEMCEPVFLSDPGHFFELAQASARGQFHRADYVAARARGFVQRARAELHLSSLPGAEPAAPVTLANFCQAVWYAANAAIGLHAFPAGRRRLMLKLAAVYPELYDSFGKLFGGEVVAAEAVQLFLNEWAAAYRAGQREDDEMIHPARRTLYERGFQAHIQAGRPADCLWLMLYTWQALLKNLPGDCPQAESWAAFLEKLQMDSPAAFASRVALARQYLERAVAIVEQWAEREGV